MAEQSDEEFLAMVSTGVGSLLSHHVDRLLAMVRDRDEQLRQARERVEVLETLARRVRHTLAKHVAEGGMAASTCAYLIEWIDEAKAPAGEATHP